MTAYVSSCPNCGSDVDVPETTGWAPMDDPEDHGDGGWSRPVICSSCQREYLVHWTGILPTVESETFYKEINIGKGRVRSERMRLLLGRAPNSPDAPTGLTHRDIDRLIRKGGTQAEMTQRIGDIMLATCASQVGLTVGEAQAGEDRRRAAEGEQEGSSRFFEADEELGIPKRLNSDVGV